MSPPPKIFISAVSKELRQQRELIGQVLRKLQFEPIFQNEFPNGQGNIREMLQKRIKPCVALIQLVGHAQGQNIKDAARPEDVISYTQYEAKFAGDMPIPTWYILLHYSWKPPLLDEHGQPVAAEDDKALRAQLNYRDRIGDSPLLYQTIADDKELKIAIYEMFPELDELRLPEERWINPVHSTHPPSTGAPQPPIDIEAVATKVLDKYLQRVPAVRQQSDGKDEKDREDALLTELAHVRGEDIGVLRRKLVQQAAEVQKDESEPLLKRAEAAFARKEYQEAERLAVQAADEAKKSQPLDKNKVLQALEIAGLSASERRDDMPALQHLKEAAALTDKERDPLEWARLHHSLADTLDDRGEYVQAEKLLQQAIDLRKTRLGPEHPDTLSSRNNLALVLYAQGKYAEADAEHRAVLQIRERVLGYEHPRTLASRNNLALILRAQGQYAEAEAEHRAVLQIQERLLGPEHPNTLDNRNNLAIVLRPQGKYTEAEAEHRAVLKIRECVLGPEHPRTLDSRNNLAIVLRAQGKYAEAEVEHRAVLQIRGRVLGSEHPSTLNSRNNLAATLRPQGKYAEAEAEHRAVLQIRERVLDPEHPNTISSMYNLALCLQSQGKVKEALPLAQRAAETGAKKLGPEHPDAKEYQKLHQQLTAKNNRRW